MASINQVIERVGRQKSNVIDERDQAKWLIDLDNRVYGEMTMVDEPDRKPPQSWPEDGDKEMVAQAPYDNIYDLYLKAMVEFYMREYTEYNNTAEMFGQAMNEYRAFYRRTHMPKRTGYRGIV